MPACAVASCSNHDLLRAADVTYHRFPVDKTLRKLWINACRRKESFNPNNARVCSAHFSEEDFQRDLRAELLHCKPRRCFIKDVVPHINIPGVATSSSDALKRSKRLESRKRKRYVTDVSECNKAKIPKMSDNNENVCEKSDVCVETDVELLGSCSLVKEIIERHEKESNSLRNEINFLKKCNEALKKRSLYWQNKSKVAYAEYRKILHENAIAKKSSNKTFVSQTVQEKLSDILKGVFSEVQIRALLTKKKVKWSSTDIVTAITLRGLSKRAYNFIRNKMHLPLPGITTLKRWVCDIRFSPGILHEVLQMMSSRTKVMTDFEKLCVLSLDEMSVDSKIAYDHADDAILGPHKLVQVVMVRGLTNSWKQPVFYQFDCRMRRNLMLEIINKIEETGFHVVAMISDLGAGNQALWKELDISVTKTSFLNPYDSSRSVFVFADVPHLLKLLRNHVMDSGIELPSGQIVDKSVFLKLLQKDIGELKLCHKFSEKHILVKNAERMKVSYAAQTFSHHIASALRYLIPSEVESANFIELINNAFDILNSRCPTNATPLKCAYGFQIPYQKDVLETTKETMMQIRVLGKKRILPFQHGFSVTITSLNDLYTYVCTLGVKYILTSRLNQDCLENMFSQIRGMGHGYNHPLPSEFKNRLRLLLLRGQMIGPSSHSSVLEEEGSSFLTTDFLNSLRKNCDFINSDMCIGEALEDTYAIEKESNTSVDNPATSNSSVTFCKTEEDALKYIAGYLVFRSKDPLLFDSTVHEVVNNTGWIDILSRGSLIKPSEEFVEKVKKFEAIFQKVHGETFSKSKGVIGRLFSELQKKFPETDEKILRVFSRLRTFVRIKYLNRCATEKRDLKTKKKNLQWVKSILPSRKKV